MAGAHSPYRQPGRRRARDEDANFRTTVVPELQKADTQLHNGDPAARIAMWSRRDPVTLFGAFHSGTGWDEIRSYTLRVTTISRREGGQWRVVHRHADNVVPPRAGHPA